MVLTMPVACSQVWPLVYSVSSAVCIGSGLAESLPGEGLKVSVLLLGLVIHSPIAMTLHRQLLWDPAGENVATSHLASMVSLSLIDAVTVGLHDPGRSSGRMASPPAAP
jgi:hypothetical protein